MRPVKNMYATQEEWQKALIQWMNEEPTPTNGKKFMVFEGKEATAETFMFEGDMLDFADSYFAANEWSEVTAFAADHSYIIITEDDERWDDLIVMLDEAELAEEDRLYGVDFEKNDATNLRRSTVSSSEWED